jgi:hypothetical protein
LKGIRRLGNWSKRKIYLSQYVLCILLQLPSLLIPFKMAFTPYGKQKSRFLARQQNSSKSFPGHPYVFWPGFFMFKNKSWLGMVAHACILLATGRSWLQASLGKKFTRPYFNQLGMVVQACDLSYAGGVGRRIVVQAGPGQKCRHYLKNN